MTKLFDLVIIGIDIIRFYEVREIRKVISEKEKESGLLINEEQNKRIYLKNSQIDAIFLE